MTDAERRLWFRLRGKQIGGRRFRRQVPIGPYIVDFACLEARLVIEVDGSQHFDAAPLDGQRTALLESRGLRVLRFWNTDVLQETDAVLEVVYAALVAGVPPVGSQT